MRRTRFARFACLALPLLALACGSTAGSGAPDDLPGSDAVDVPGDLADVGLDIDRTDATPADVPAEAAGDPGPEAGAAECGNGLREGDEQCDKVDLGDATCASLGYAGGGDLACGDICLLDRSGCVGPWTCPADPGEPNDKWETATLLPPGVHDRALCAAASPADEDWYRIPAPATGREALAVVFDDSLGQIEAQIHGHLRGPSEPPVFVVNVVAPWGGSADGITRKIWTWDDRYERPDPLYLRLFDLYRNASLPYRVVYLENVECFPVDHTYLPELRCPTGSRCAIDRLEFRCVEGCGADFDCAEDQRCVAGACKQSQCETHGDCPAGQGCDLYQQCVDAPCDDAADCEAFSTRGKLLCDTDLGRCVGCLTAQDCPAEFACVDTRCRLDCQEDDFFPNPDAAQAATIGLQDGTFEAPDLTLCGVGATDWFRVTLDQAGPLRVEVDSPLHAQMAMGLYRDPDMSPVGGQGRNAPDRAAILFEPGPGTYLLSLQNYPWSTSKQVVPYALRLTTVPPECVRSRDCPVGQGCGLFECVATSCALDAECAFFGLPCDESAGFCAPCGADADCGSLEACQENRCEPTCTDDPYEDNDTREAAAPLADGTHDLQLCKARGDVEQDWFAVDLEAGQSVAAYVQPTWDLARDGNPPEWPVLLMFRPDGTQVYPMGDGSGPLYHQVLAAGTVHLLVSSQTIPGAEPWGPIPYRLFVGVDPECAGTPWSSDCDDGTYCGDFRCLPGCATPDQCEPGLSCLDNACTAPFCVRHDACPAGEACGVTACFPGPACDEDWDCENGDLAQTLYLGLCDTDLGRCVECRDAVHCPNPEQCVDGACAFPCEDDAFEPNDRRQAATAVALGTFPDLALCARPSRGSDPANWPGEEDWFVVDLPAGRLLAAQLDNSDVFITLFDADGTEIGMGPFAAQGGTVVIGEVDAGGRTWVRIRKQPSLQWVSAPYSLGLYEAECRFSTECAPGSYCEGGSCEPATCAVDMDCLVAGTGRLCDTDNGWCVDCFQAEDCGSAGGSLCEDSRCVPRPCDPDVFEPNSRIEDAAPVTIPLDAPAMTLCEMGEQDWFAPDLQEGTAYVLKAWTEGTIFGLVEMRLYRYDADRTWFGQVAYGANQADGVEIRYTAGDPGGGWLLGITHVGPEPTIVYRLTMDEAQ